MWRKKSLQNDLICVIFLFTDSAIHFQSISKMAHGKKLVYKLYFKQSERERKEGRAHMQAFHAQKAFLLQVECTESVYDGIHLQLAYLDDDLNLLRDRNFN